MLRGKNREGMKFLHPYRSKYDTNATAAIMPVLYTTNVGVSQRIRLKFKEAACPKHG